MSTFDRESAEFLLALGGEWTSDDGRIRVVYNPAVPAGEMSIGGGTWMAYRVKTAALPESWTIEFTADPEETAPSTQVLLFHPNVARQMGWMDPQRWASHETMSSALDMAHRILIDPRNPTYAFEWNRLVDIPPNDAAIRFEIVMNPGPRKRQPSAPSWARFTDPRYGRRKGRGAA